MWYRLWKVSSTRRSAATTILAEIASEDLATVKMRFRSSLITLRVAILRLETLRNFDI